MSRPKESPRDALIALFTTGDLDFCKDLLKTGTVIVNARAKMLAPAMPRKQRSDAGKPRKADETKELFQ